MAPLTQVLYLYEHSLPCMQVAEDLPALGTALPVLVPQLRGQPARPLPAVGDWIKLKVVGMQLHEVRATTVGCCQS